MKRREEKRQNQLSLCLGKSIILEGTELQESCQGFLSASGYYGLAVQINKQSSGDKTLHNNIMWVMSTPLGFVLQGAKGVKQVANVF